MYYDTTKPYKPQIKDLIRKTWDSCPYIKVLDADTEYPVFQLEHRDFPYMIDHSDGVGTKGMLHWYNRTFKAAVMDALAMNINDLATVRAIPFKLQNHLILPEDDHPVILETIEALCKQCINRRIAVTGGETSIQDNVQGMDLSITMSGLIKEYKPNKCVPGDTLIGLPSAGLHANGYTMVRSLLSKEKWTSDQWKAQLTQPTRIYDLKKVWDNVNGIIHIAGGGFTRLKQYLVGCEAEVRLMFSIPNIFHEIHRYGVSVADMYKTYNCGVGMVLSVAKEHVFDVLTKTSGLVIGTVKEADGEHKKVTIHPWIGENREPLIL